MTLALQFYDFLKFFHVPGKLVGLIETHGADAAVVKQRIRTIVNVAPADSLVLLAIVFLMVTKLGQ